MIISPDNSLQHALQTSLISPNSRIHLGLRIQTVIIPFEAHAQNEHRCRSSSLIYSRIVPKREHVPQLLRSPSPPNRQQNPICVTHATNVEDINDRPVRDGVCLHGIIYQTYGLARATGRTGRRRPTWSNMTATLVRISYITRRCRRRSPAMKNDII